ncbi:hypothetical protein AC249_AIPGENE24815 [Exaiptasia diaphana]|nr:hypothetical protein AC249_AIPGENE24815 [Exaiptasia diaphana]
MTFKQPERQVAHWLEQLQEYDFEVEHRPGKYHQNADAMSRKPRRQHGDCPSCWPTSDPSMTFHRLKADQEVSDEGSTETNVWSWSLLAKAQKEDPDIGVIFSLILQEERKPTQAMLQGMTSKQRAVAAQFQLLEVKTVKEASNSTDVISSSTAPTDIHDGLFTCPEVGCVKSYQRWSALQHHLEIGKHERALENDTLMDKAAQGYAERLEQQAVAIPNVIEVAGKKTKESERSAPAEMGWALKSTQSTKKRFSDKQKTYLMKMFQLGESTGYKADPSAVSKAMIKARGDDGNRLFNSEDFLTTQQIRSFFSRTASKKRLDAKTTQCTDELIEDDDNLDYDDENAEEEYELEELTNRVNQEIGLQHPIVYDSHNICELLSANKLNKFNIKMLKIICSHFELDTSEITAKLKQPYISKLRVFWKNCSC